MTWGLFGLIVLIAFIFYIIMQIAVDSTRLVVREYEITSPRIEETRSIVFLSDLHGKKYGKNNEHLLAMIKELAPNMVLLGGDMITAVPGKTDFSAGLKLASDIKSDYPMVYALGNHEFRAREFRDRYGTLYEDYEKALKAEGVSFTDNECVELFPGVKIWSLSLKYECYKKFKPYHLEEDYIESVLGKCDDKAFNVLLAHNPDYFEYYADWGADLTLSGHVHGGVVRIPGWKGVISPRWALFPKYDGGEFDIDGKKMILSRGLGMHTIPLRLFNPAEIVYIKLMKEK